MKAKRLSVGAEKGQFWELVDRERHYTWRLCRALTRSYDDAADLLSDTVLAAYQSFPALRDEQAFRKFLSTIAVRIERRKRWRNRIFTPLAEAEECFYEPVGESSHDLNTLLLALDRLPIREREAIVLFEITGLSIKEIQEIQGGTLSGVKSRMARARNRLKGMLVESELAVFQSSNAGKAASSALVPAGALQ